MILCTLKTMTMKEENEYFIHKHLYIYTTPYP